MSFASNGRARIFMNYRRELPTSLVGLAGRQALRLSLDRFDANGHRLLRMLGQMIDDVRVLASRDAPARPAGGVLEHLTIGPPTGSRRGPVPEAVKAAPSRQTCGSSFGDLGAR